MRLREFWNTTTSRLTVLYGVVFAVGVMCLLGMVYIQSAVYLTRRVDHILQVKLDAFSRYAAAELPDRVRDGLAIDGDQINLYALFDAKGDWRVGNLKALPPNLEPGGRPIELPPSATFPANARVISRRMADGDVLVIGRDVNQLREMRYIILQALLLSGVFILSAGLVCGTALSVSPMRRLRELKAVGQQIAAGDLKRRMPISHRRDELDMFAAIVNGMMDEVDRLMSEVRSVGETIAHDLRTPLTRARSQLHRFRQTLDRGDPPAVAIDGVVDELDATLDRFRAILRISELEARRRREGFVATDLSEIVAKVGELYQPLAESQDIRFAAKRAAPAWVEADPKLLFEAVSNLVDNALKFTPPGGRVEVGLAGEPAAPSIVVADNGPGVPDGERGAVLERFYRSERDRLVAGSGLGLSIVAAIVRLHRFDLRLEDAVPGLRAVIRCRAGG